LVRERASENDERLVLGTGQGDTDAETQEGEEIHSREDCSGEEEVRAEESGSEREKMVARPGSD
jgi:hypothetical protein